MLCLKISCILLLSAIAVCRCESNRNADLNESYCDGTGWVSYKDEKCFKLVKKPLTRDEAKDACQQEESQIVSIKSPAEQEYLTELVFDTSAVVANVWIGAKRLNENNFAWDDGTKVDFSNWVDSNPSGDIRRNCAVMQSELSRKLFIEQINGKWKDVTCEQWNFVVCEKLQKWSILKLQQVLLDTRKDHEDSLEYVTIEMNSTKIQLENTQNQLSTTQNELRETKVRLSIAESQIENSKTNSVPIGFIYPQLPNEKMPTNIWPLMQWTEVSSAYAGVFFRVSGGNAAAFGSVQEEFSPWLSKFSRALSYDFTEEIEIPRSGWSKAICAAAHAHSSGMCLPTKFHTTGGEVRPRNMAIRIWKRTG